ncbi:MAG TPA: glycosyltransferase [Candidatus Saccharimonadales bacterium]|nr:glycosyltransferase [Candidatus Saccharimonadales bacterium]
MNILWAKSGTLLPPDSGGTIRSLNLLKELAKRHKITLFLFYGEHANDRHAELKATFHEVITVPMPLPAKKRGAAEAMAYARNFLSPWPYSVAKYCRPEAAKRLRETVRSGSFDVLICDFLFATKAIPWDLSVPKVLFTHNVEEMIWRRSYEHASNPIWKIVTWREYRRMAAVERRYVQEADQVLAVSENDKKYFTSYADTGKITVVPTGVDVDYFSPIAKEEIPGRIVFTGSMDWMANEDAIFYMHEAIFGKIRAQIPAAETWVVGRNPSVKLTALGEAGVGIHVTGSVDDVRPYMAESSVYVVPMRIGGGTRIKIYEAMAMGKAVVSTSIGAEGLPVTHGQNIILSDDPSEFAAHVVRLLNDRVERNRIGAAARKLVEENYSWASVVKSFEDVLEKAIRGKSSPVPSH